MYMPPGILADERLSFEPTPAKTKKPAPARAAVKPAATAPAAAAKPDRDRVLSALGALDPLMGYADWLKVGQALHDWDRAAMSLWDDWSSKGGNYKTGKTADKWTGFTAGGGITIATLFSMAKSAGWKAPRRKAEQPPPPDIEEGPDGFQLVPSPRGDGPVPPEYFAGMASKVKEMAIFCFKSGVEFAHDELRGQLVMTRGKAWKVPDEQYRASLWHLTQDQEKAKQDGADKSKPTNYENFRRRVSAITAFHTRHAFRDYLETLAPWDGTPRLDGWHQTAGLQLDAGQSAPLTQWAARAPLLAAVARTYRPGTKIDECPVLVGPPGIGKSLSVQHLLPPSMGDLVGRHLDLTAPDKEKLEAIMGKVIIEVSEMSPPPRGIEKAKAFLSATRINDVRLAYRRDPVDMPMRCALIGTSNEHACLADDDGLLRRFAVVGLAGGDPAAVVAWLRKNRGQMWAEALYRVLEKGEAAHLPPALAEAQKEANSDYIDRDNLMIEAIEQNEFPFIDPFTIRQAIDTLKQVMKFTDTDIYKKANEMRVARALAKTGYTRKRHRTDNGRAWLWERNKSTGLTFVKPEKDDTTP